MSVFCWKFSVVKNTVLHLHLVTKLVQNLTWAVIMLKKAFQKQWPMSRMFKYRCVEHMPINTPQDAEIGWTPGWPGSSNETMVNIWKRTDFRQNFDNFSTNFRQISENFPSENFVHFCNQMHRFFLVCSCQFKKRVEKHWIQIALFFELWQSVFWSVYV